ncbi:MAG: response regulator [Paludisphaera borealis]|uniref:response regulator n=1 Tax=Paludisphaera borealis TaxID=1387353 RepID=UPI00283F40C0|nr:response regulator [Paludisphaera borealis]MDR3618308.1 response regulator [Paludisphaera borealis]
MEPTSSASPSPAAAETPVAGVLLSRDLLFTVKITGTARELGFRVVAVGDAERASAMIEEHRPKAVFVDLAAGPLAAPESLVALQRTAGPETPFIAFGSHVDPQALAAAKAAGCREVMPRSKFSAELPDIVRRLLG